MSQQQLAYEITKLSHNVTWELAKEEWKLNTIYIDEDLTTCTCGHFPIKEVCILRNKINGKYVHVGNCCVKKFMGLPSDLIFQAVKRVQADNTKSLNVESHIDWMIAIPSILVGVLGIAVATIMYKKENALPDKVAASFSFFYRWAFKKFYVDEFYMFVTKKIIFNYISRPVAWFDRHIVDGTMNGIANLIVFVSFNIKGLQSGRVQQYAFVFVGGVVAMVLIFVYVL